MDIHSAKLNVEKLLSYVEELSANQPKMYSKSKDRLRDIANTCNQVVTIISDLLQEEMLNEDSIEFSESSKIVAPVLDNISYQLDAIQTFSGNANLITGYGSGPSNPVAMSALLDEQTALTPAIRKRVFANYTSCIAKLPSNSNRYLFAHRCANLLWSWFKTRFHDSVSNTSFKYNMRKFPEWVQGFVVMYGKAIHDNRVANFEYEIQSWVNNIMTSEARDKYAVPFPVYQFCKRREPSDLTLDAVVLWDILLDCGLDELCTADKQDLYLGQNDIYNLCDSLNPSVLDNYCDYSSHPEIFKILRWEVKPSA